jgi:hypothetical protein
MTYKSYRPKGPTGPPNGFKHYCAVAYIYEFKFLQISFPQLYFFLQWRWRLKLFTKNFFNGAGATLKFFCYNFCWSNNPLVVGGGPAMQLLIPNFVNTIK